MIIALVTQFHVYLPWVNAHLALYLNSVLNVKALICFLEGPSRDLLRDCENFADGSFAALVRRLLLLDGENVERLNLNSVCCLLS